MKILLLFCLLMYVVNPFVLPIHAGDSSNIEVMRLQHQMDSLRTKIATDSVSYYADVQGQMLRYNRSPIEEVMGMTTGIVTIVGIVFIFYLFLSSRNKERMAAIDRGLDSETIKAMFSNHYRSRVPSGLNALRWGFLAIGCGGGALFGVLSHNEPAAFIGAIIGGGVGLVFYYTVARKQETPEPPTPPEV